MTRAAREVDAMIGRNDEAPKEVIVVRCDIPVPPVVR